MKQHITTEQLNELSEKGKGKLREWWKPKVGDLPLLSIGQMIEFLDEQIDKHNQKVDENDEGEYIEYSIERLLDRCWRLNGYFKTIEYSNLTDALFSAVKEILET